MAFAGLRGTGSFGTDERPKNFREMILWLDPNGQAPIFALTAKMAKEVLDDPQTSWWEETLEVTRVRLNDASNMNTLDTAVVLDNGGLKLLPGDLLMVETTEASAYDSEIVMVTAVTDDNNITISRAAAGSTAAAIPDDTYFTKIGSAHSEGSGAPSVMSTNPTKFTNYCQIFKTAYEVTGTAQATRFRTGDPVKNEQIRKAFDHAAKIEASLLFGKPSETTGSNGQPLRTMGGLRSFLTSNRTVYGSPITINTFLDAVAPVFNYSGEGAGDQRIAFCGNSALNALNKAIKDASTTMITYDGVVSVYGMKFGKFIMPQGELLLKTHPLMNVHERYQKSMFIINPAGLKYRPLKGRDTHVVKNIQANDSDTKKDQWLTECTMELHHEKTMAYLGNIYVS